MKDVLAYFKESLQALFRSWGWEHLAEGIGLLIDSGAIIVLSGILVWIGKQSWALYRQHVLARDLHPYFDARDVKEHTQYYIPTYFQNTTPTNRNEPGETYGFVAREKLIPFFLKKAFKDRDSHRFYLILADSGMGKTTFMINLYIRYLSRPKWLGRKYEIKLFPLGDPKVLGKIHDIKNKEHTILLLDAFDEDAEAAEDYPARLKEILDGVRDFREVLITCRSQFFSKAEDEPFETHIRKHAGDAGYQKFGKMYVSPFSDRDIRRYIRKRFRFYEWTNRRQALKIVNSSKDLMARPLLLSYVKDLMGSKKPFEYGFQIYQALIDKWIDREVRRVSPDRDREAYRDELYKFTFEFAMVLYKRYRNTGEQAIAESDILPLAQQMGISLSEIELKGRSLLNRNAGNRYKFAHKSIWEYLLALQCSKDHLFAGRFGWEGMDQTVQFYSEMMFGNLISNTEQTNQKYTIYYKNQDQGIERNTINPSELARIRSIVMGSKKEMEIKLKYYNKIEWIVPKQMIDLILGDLQEHYAIYPFVEMVMVKEGSFEMVENGQWKTIHRVHISDFYISKFPVTQALWMAVMGDNPASFKGCDNCPVENISWSDAQNFIQKLNQLSGKQYRLPSEAEWEFAARGGTQSKGFDYSGSNKIAEVAWYSDNSRHTTHPVGKKKPNELGIYDMSGNVWEWCEDDWHDGYQGAPVNGSAWINRPDRGTYRVLRGGSWFSDARSCRVSYRFINTPDYRHIRNGFRLALPPSSVET